MIVDFSYIEDKIDCSGLSSQSDLYTLTTRSSIDAAQVCEVNSGVVTISDAGKFADACEFLSDNSIATQSAVETILTSAQDCKLRASELVRIFVELAYNYNADVVLSGGTPMPGGVVKAAVYGGVTWNGYTNDTGIISGRMAFTSGEGYHAPDYMRNLQGWWTIASSWVNLAADTEIQHIKRVRIEQDCNFTVYYADGTTQACSGLRGLSIDGYNSSGDGRNGRVSLCLEIIDNALYGHLHIEYSDHGMTTGTLVKLCDLKHDTYARSVWSDYGNKYVVDKKKDDGTIYMPWDTDETWTRNFPSTGEPFADAQLYMYPQIFVGSSYSWSGEGYAITATKKAESTYIKGTALDPIDLELQGSVSGGFLDIPRRVTPRLIDTPVALYNRQPKEVHLSDDALIRVSFNANSPGLVLGSAKGTASITRYEDIPQTTATAIVQCVRDQDAPSPYERLETITVEQLQNFYNGMVFADDPYVTMLYDNTCLTYGVYMLETILASLLLTSTDDHIRVSTVYPDVSCYVEADAHLGDSFHLYPWSKIEVDGVFVDADHFEAGWGYILEGVLHITDDAHVFIDNIVISGECMQEVWRAMQSDTYQGGFVTDLVRARTDALTTMMLYTAINGVLNTTDWLSEIGQFLKSVVDETYKATTTLLASIADMSPAIMSTKRALILGEAYNKIPATRVATLVDAAASAGAKSAAEALSMLTLMTDDAGYSALSIQDSRSRSILSRLKIISPYAKYRMGCLEQRPARNGADSYISTFFSRTADAITSALGSPNTGVEPQVADFGVGLPALYPALVLGNITVTDVSTIPIEHAIVIPLQSSYIVISPGFGDNNYDVGWYAGTRGGSDLDVLQDVDCSLRELRTLVDSVGESVGVSLTYSDVTSISYTGGSDLVNATSIITGALTGAAIGAVLGSAIPGAGTLAGAGVGALVGGIYGTGLSLLAMASQSDVTTENLNYDLRKLDGVDLKLHYQQQMISDPGVVQQSIAHIIMASLYHGAYYPYGADTQLGYPIVAMDTPGQPFFRYITKDPVHDWSPLVITGFTLLSIVSIKAILKARTNLAWVPGFIPLTIASSITKPAVKSLGFAYDAFTSEQDASYAMQKSILDSVEGIQTGTYTDSEGTVTLRDVTNMMSSEFMNLQSLVEKVARDTGATYLSY